MNDLDKIIEELNEIIMKVESISTDTPFKASCQKNVVNYIDLAIENLKRWERER